VLSSARVLPAAALLIGPVTSAIWLIGLGTLFFRRDWKPYRVFGIAYLIALTIFIVFKGAKNYYLAPHLSHPDRGWNGCDRAIYRSTASLDAARVCGGHLLVVH